MTDPIVRLELEEGATILFLSGDITGQTTDAIVNAANSSLMGGGGVDGAIHAAGGPAILEECRKIVMRDGHLPPGEAVQTTGGRMLADRMGLHSLAYPAISCGVYGYPPQAAAEVAVCTVVDELKDARSVHEARFVLYSSQMYETFLQAAHKEQHRRNAVRWKFISVPAAVER